MSRLDAIGFLVLVFSWFALVSPDPARAVTAPDQVPEILVKQYNRSGCNTGRAVRCERFRGN